MLKNRNKKNTFSRIQGKVLLKKYLDMISHNQWWGESIVYISSSSVEETRKIYYIGAIRAPMVVKYKVPYERLEVVKDNPKSLLHIIQYLTEKIRNKEKISIGKKIIIDKEESNFEIVKEEEEGILYPQDIKEVLASLYNQYFIS